MAKWYHKICWRGPTGGKQSAWAEGGADRLSRTMRSFVLVDDHGEATGTVLAVSVFDVVGLCFAKRDARTGRLKLKRADCSPCGR